MWCLGDRNKEIGIDESTRILPKETKSFKKQDSPFIVFCYGVTPPFLNRRRIPFGMLKSGIKKLACGAEHFMLLTQDNNVLVAGNNEYGQCARNPQLPIKNLEKLQEGVAEETPQNLKLNSFSIDNHEVLDVACGSHHGLLLVEHKTTGKKSVLAVGHELPCGFLDKTHRSVPTQVLLPEEHSSEVPKAVFAGHMRSCILMESGKVLIWGEWFNGMRQRRPKEVHFNLEGDSVKKVAIGKMFALFVTVKGKLFSIGDNTYGELGLGFKKRYSSIPVLVSTVEKEVLDCAAGARHCVVLDKFGKVYSFGDNSEGQCGVESARCYLPEEIPTKGVFGEENVQIRFIYAGDAHSAIVTSDGDLFMWGDNSAGRLGMEGNCVLRPTIAEEVLGRNICEVGLGGLFSMVLVGMSQYSLIDRNTNLIKSFSLISGMVSKEIQGN